MMEISLKICFCWSYHYKYVFDEYKMIERNVFDENTKKKIPKILNIVEVMYF